MLTSTLRRRPVTAGKVNGVTGPLLLNRSKVVNASQITCFKPCVVYSSNELLHIQAWARNPRISSLCLNH